MTIIKNEEEYINRRALGDEVVSIATLFGYEAMTKNLNVDNFLVLEMGKSDFSFYRYKVSDGKFRVLDFKETVGHQIGNFLTPEMLEKDAITRWWYCVFYERDGVCTYDDYYNNLAISDNNDITFEKLINDVADCVSSLPLPTSTDYLFLTGDLMNNPVLRHVLQKQFGQGKVHLLPKDSLNEDFDETEIVILPNSLGQLALNTNEAVKLKEITSNPISITLPFDSMNNEMVPGVKWKDMLVDGKEEQKDYSVGNMDFKNISLRVECDAFQNIFLACQDLRGNRKIICRLNKSTIWKI